MRIFENKIFLKTRGLYHFNDINQNIITMIKKYFKQNFDLTRLCKCHETYLILSVNSVQILFSEENGNIIFVSFLVHK